MPPDIETEGTQEELGWEDLTSTGSGQSDMGEEYTDDSKPKTEEDQERTAKAPPEGTHEPPAAGELTEPQAKVAVPAGGQPKEGVEQTWTLDGGRQVTAAELAAHPELITEIVTRSNQTSNFQRLAEQREQQRLQAEAEQRRLLDQYTAWQIQQQQRTENEQRQPPPQRPDTKTLEGVYGSHLDKLVTDGRLTQDQRNEFGNVLAEYMFDQQNTTNLINNVVALGEQRIAQIEQQLFGEIVPDVQQRKRTDAYSADYYVQQTAAAQPGYEALATPEEWNRLKLFIAEKVNASPRDAEGNPTFDPMFDAPSMMQMYDAMTGADLRAKLAEQKAAQEAAAAAVASKAGGETAARASKPPLRQPSKMTPEDEAMDFSDPRLATG